MSILALMLSACSSGSSVFDAMARGKWADTPGECGRRFTTFSDKTIRWHFPDGNMDFGRVALVNDSSSTDVVLTVEPSDAIKRAAQRRGAKPLPRAVTMGFRLNGEQLRLLAMVGDSGPVVAVDGNAMEARLFNLVKCPD